MGADLYIRSETEKSRKRYEKQYDAAIAKRNRLAELHPEVHCCEPNCHPDLKAAQDEVWRLSELSDGPGYFRDPYNRWSLMAQLGIDWDSLPYINIERKDGDESYTVPCLDELGAAFLAGLVETRQIGNDYAMTAQAKLGAAVLGMVSKAMPEATVTGGTPPDSLGSEDLAYFVKRKGELLAFLRLALELGEPIEVSY